MSPTTLISEGLSVGWETRATCRYLGATTHRSSHEAKQLLPTPSTQPRHPACFGLSRQMSKAKKSRQAKRLQQHPYRKPSAPKPSKPHACPPLPPSSSSSQTKPKQQNQTQQSLPFDPTSAVLLLGEGDLSFSLSLAAHHSCTSLTATTLETRSSLLAKHPQAAAHISALEAAGHVILYSIDATKLGLPGIPNAACLRRRKFDVVVFNFPHVGGRSTDVNRQVRSNQALVAGALQGARRVLREGGRMLLTVFEGMPYELWGVRNLARHVGLKIERSFKFAAEQYPSYKHARTLGNVEGGGGWKGEEREARTFVLREQGWSGIGDEKGKEEGESEDRQDEDGFDDSD